MACKPMKTENVLLVDKKGTPAKHTESKKEHDYTYLESEMCPAARGKDEWKEVNLTLKWECSICGRVVSQVVHFCPPKSTKKTPLVEIEDTETK